MIEIYEDLTLLRRGVIHSVCDGVSHRPAMTNTRFFAVGRHDSMLPNGAVADHRFPFGDILLSSATKVCKNAA